MERFGYAAACVGRSFTRQTPGSWGLCLLAVALAGLVGSGCVDWNDDEDNNAAGISEEGPRVIEGPGARRPGGEGRPGGPALPEPEEEPVSCERVIKADVVAIDQIYVYNRYGSYNPFGMMYALRRDVVALEGDTPGPGNARLRDGKRPRPLVLRANEGDCLDIQFENWLNPEQCRAPIEGNPAFFRSDRGPGECDQSDTPATRAVSVQVNGMQYLGIEDNGAHVGFNATRLVAPGEQANYRLYAEKEGTYLMRSMGAVTGGQGLGATTALGLFGAVNVQPQGARWFRSQITHEEMLRAARMVDDAMLLNPDDTPQIDYNAEHQGVPVLSMLNANLEIVHSDLTAIIAGFEPTRHSPVYRGERAYREFTIIFHDEAKVVQAFEELDHNPTLKGLADHAAINYGIAGAGAMVLGNRKGIGPNTECINCKFEEFFMASWPNGDPAMNVRLDEEGTAVEALWPDDPSNVYHSYVRDPVRIRNLHAGPRETHVFHLHGNQWLRSPDDDQSAYTDSQTLGPGDAFTYDIAHGGSGNRNLSPGDNIFHCHLYPHFAGGMWGLWRNHDVFEDGSIDRYLPDGEIHCGTPTPALVPLPTRAIPPLPTYETTQVYVDGKLQDRPAMPGYPFYIAAVGGKRAPLNPLVHVEDGGLGRHLVMGAPEGGVVYGERGPFDVKIQEAHVKLLPDEGLPGEQDAMLYHEGGFPGAVSATTPYGFEARAYPAYLPDGQPGQWFVNGKPRRKGAPFANPCPADAPVRRYRMAAIETEIVTNKAGWRDPQGRIYVLEEDIEATLSGERPTEPLVIRANSGDCLEVELTNLMPAHLEEDDFQMFTSADMVGLHMHQVKFDMGSDGGMNGFNYENGSHSPEEVAMMVAAINAAGGAFVGGDGLDASGDRVELELTPHPRLGVMGAQTVQQVYWVDPVLDDEGNDRTVGASFFHDHMSAASWQQHGMYGMLVAEPAGSRWRDPQTGELYGTRVDGGPTSYRADILTANAEDSFREFALALADFALLYDGDRPVNPPIQKEEDLPWAIGHEDEPRPEAISASDPGTMLINYRQEPLPLRVGEQGPEGWQQKAGEEGDMAQAFSSVIHGDPATPLLRAYSGDRVKLRLVQAAHEEQHVFGVFGQKWLREPDHPDSGYVAAQQIGLSENFTADLGPMAASYEEVSDYLYGSFPTDDLWSGMWGLLRVFRDAQPDLLPLPETNARSWPGRRPRVCPPGAPKRRYTVHAILARGNLPDDRLTYNATYDLYDPDAILFVKEEHLEDLRAGRRAPEPLVLRAAAGECIKVRLVNELPEEMPPSSLHFNFNPPIVDKFNTNQIRTSNHVSLQPQFVTHDVHRGGGANVGLNREQTVPPGEERQFDWYAGVWSQGRKGIVSTPIEFGAINLRSMADVVNHGVHGAMGALIVEPLGASWESDADTDAQATVSYVDSRGHQRTFREFVMVLQDEIALHSGNPVFQGGDPLEPTVLRNNVGADDAEESGHKGFNYRTEPLWARLGVPPDYGENALNDLQQYDLLSSAVHGDPATPVFRAEPGDNLRVRVLLPSGHPRQHAIGLLGATWPVATAQTGSFSQVLGANESTFYTGSDGGLAAGKASNLIPLHGAGGPFKVRGDFLLFDQASIHFYGGTWGLMRVGSGPGLDVASEDAPAESASADDTPEER
ncbi:copper oxidase [Lujinxingia litoralis]|uniref:copper oxidase n=1 Tax=Lujinxingia litoralis TaxID=2211119 RepID=UPI0013147196|nr:copper oxidase [Lujinxingia litoralis]